jgi:hypothetical protein
MDRKLPGNQITTAIWQEITPLKKAPKFVCMCTVKMNDSTINFTDAPKLLRFLCV